jgi:hypothetical protein
MNNELVLEFRNLSTAGATSVPWLCAGAVVKQIEEGVLESGPLDFQAAGLFGACLSATNLLSGPKGHRLAVEFAQVDNRATRKFFRTLSRGARKIGAYENGLELLMNRTIPAAEDGIHHFRGSPQELARHMAFYWSLALSSGVGSVPPMGDSIDVLNVVLPPPPVN